MSVFSRIASEDSLVKDLSADLLQYSNTGVTGSTGTSNVVTGSGDGGFNGTVGYDSTTGEISFGGSVDTNGDNNNVSETGIPNVQFDDKTIILSYLKNNWYWFVGGLIAVGTAMYFIMKPKNNKKKR